MPSTTAYGDRPFVLFLCHPLTGHLTPTLKIAKELSHQRYEVFFLGSTAHEKRISASGATFIRLQGEADYDDILYYSTENPDPPVPGYHTLSWKDRALVDVTKQWLDPIPDQWISVKSTLSALHKRDPKRDVIVIAEAVFHGLLPLFYGAPLPQDIKRPRAVLGLSVTVPLLRSAHLPPFGSSLPFDQHLRNSQVLERKWEAWEQRTASYKSVFNTKLAEAGATSELTGTLLDGSMYAQYDAFLQLGVPSFFFSRTDWPTNFQFVGTIPKELPTTGWKIEDCVKPDHELMKDPESWSHNLIVNWQQGKKIVIVAQGTVETDPYQLAIPTCLAMANRPDVFVLAISKKIGTEEFRAACPEVKGQRAFVDQARYDIVLPFAHAWVHNGGYGAVQHGIANGVPMVIAGEGQDKTENGKRLAYSGAGIDLRTANPSVEALAKAIDSVLDVSSYRERVNVLKSESEGLDCLRSVDRILKSFI